MFCEFLCGFDEQYVVAAGCVCFVCCVFFCGFDEQCVGGACVCFVFFCSFDEQYVAAAVEAEAAESFRSATAAALVTQF